MALSYWGWLLGGRPSGQPQNGSFVRLFAVLYAKSTIRIIVVGSTSPMPLLTYCRGQSFGTTSMKIGTITGADRYSI